MLDAGTLPNRHYSKGGRQIKKGLFMVRLTVFFLTTSLIGILLKIILNVFKSGVALCN